MIKAESIATVITVTDVYVVWCTLEELILGVWNCLIILPQLYTHMNASISNIYHMLNECSTSSLWEGLLYFLYFYFP